MALASDKKSLCRFEDYIEPKPSLHSPLFDFKLDRIFPRNINIKLSPDPHQPAKPSKLLSNTENRFYHEYMNAKEMQGRAAKKNKIAHIFNIRSINLVEKQGREERRRRSSKELKRSIDRDNRLLDLIVDTTAPPHRLEKKNSTPYLHKAHPDIKIGAGKSDNNFQNKLGEYQQWLKDVGSVQGVVVREVDSYGRNSLQFSVGRGNNGALIRQLMKKRWWWGASEEKVKHNCNFTWTQLKEKGYFLKEECPQQATQPQIHNHFENNEFLGNKKALYYSMKAYYQSHHKNVFDYLPVTFHVKRYGDEAWEEFCRYFQDKGKGLWIVKPGENSNRGKGITIHSDLVKIREWVQAQISGENNPRKTFIIQKYIQRPLLYNKRKFDIRCYMLLSRLNGQLRGYWYQEGYIRTSCYEFQLGDTGNEFIHLTNDAVQVNSEKYGKFEDGNKLSYHNFQKYLDSTQRGVSFQQQICPQLKEMCRHAIEATHHLLGGWKGLPTFEIFGLDFMIDQEMRPWLIEINTNPCLETSCCTLERVIPKMVDSAFRLTLDVLFPPPRQWQNSKKHLLPSRVGQGLFQLVFEEGVGGSGEGVQAGEMGEIEEDNEVYGQDRHIDFNS